MHPVIIPPEIKTEILPIARVLCRRPGGTFEYHAPKPTKTYRFTGTPAEFFSMLSGMEKDNPNLRQVLAQQTSAWSGLSGESGLSVTDKGYSQNALKAFETASASLGPSKTRGSPILANQGSAFFIARVIQGHPIACFKRPKTKLPPVSLDLTVNAWANRKPEDISASLAKIARAAWDYQTSGGPVSLTIHHLYHFTAPRDGHDALLISLKIPLASGAQFATAASLQFFRGVGVPLGVTLSGARGDTLPLSQWANPRSLPISGAPEEDARILAQLKIV